MRFLPLPLAALALAHLGAVAVTLAGDPMLLAGHDQGFAPRWLPALTSVLALSAGAAAAWGPGWARYRWVSGLLAAGWWCAASVFARPLSVATWPASAFEIDLAADVFRALLPWLAVAVGVAALDIWWKSKLSELAFFAALAVVLALAGWCVWDWAPVLAAALCYPTLWAFGGGMIWLGWSDRMGE